MLFDAVIFDLDGTLVATERFWVAAATRGAERAFEELGLEREMPGADEWLSMVGLPLERGFEIVFADLDADERRVVMARCIEEEEAALRAGGAAPMPGALETLRELRSLGVKLGIASNCSQGYLDTMLGELGLGELVHEARCLDSARIRDKADMIADLLGTFGTRSAVMVGDRAGDAAAAHANAIPHVHLANGLAPRGERVEAEAEIAGLRELLPRLRGRARWIEGALRELGALDGRRHALALGVTGPSASGKTLFARDAVRVVERAGGRAGALALDAFLREGARRSPLADAAGDDHLARAFDLERLSRAVLEPRSRCESTLAGPWGGAVAPDELLILEGLFLLDPRVRTRLDRLLYLALDDATASARAAAREPSGEAALRVRRHFLPAQRAFEQRFPPPAADLVLDGTNPLGA